MRHLVLKAPQHKGLLGVPFVWEWASAPPYAGIKEGIVTRDNYSYKKYQKELARKKKNEEKKQRKLDKEKLKAETSPEQPASGDLTAV